MLKVFVLGHRGQLAREIEGVAHSAACEVQFCGRQTADINDTESVMKRIRAWGPDAVVNAAAYTSVDDAESEEAFVTAINAHAPARLAVECGTLGIPFVHYSTDYVFSGEKDAPYVDTDLPSPINAYGRSKALGETLLTAAGDHCVVLRTAWLHGSFGTNYIRRMYELLTERDEIRVVTDQIGNPTRARDAGLAGIDLAKLLLAGRSVKGVLNYVNTGGASRYEVTEALASRFREDGRPIARVTKTDTSRFPLPAERPKMVVLDGSRAEALGLRTRPWQEGVNLSYDEIRAIERNSLSQKSF